MTPVIFERNKKDDGKIIKIKINNSNRNTLFGKIDASKNMRAA